MLEEPDVTNTVTGRGELILGRKGVDGFGLDWVLVCKLRVTGEVVQMCCCDNASAEGLVWIGFCEEGGADGVGGILHGDFSSMLGLKFNFT